MKINKRQLRKIIQEEKQKLDEAMSQADYAENAYAPPEMLGQFENLADRLWGEVFDAAVTDGLEEEESAELAGHVLVKTLARSLKNYTTTIGAELERLVR